MTRRFPLQTVERLRTAELDRAAGQLAVARTRVTQAEAALAGLRTELAGCLPPVKASAAEVGVLAARRELLRENVDRGESELTTLRSAAGEALATWSTARCGLRAVESLHDRHRIAEVQAELRREQLLGDELAAVLAAFPGLSRIGADPMPGGGGDAA